jgi:hypothetical protein
VALLIGCVQITKDRQVQQNEHRRARGREEQTRQPPAYVDFLDDKYSPFGITIFLRNSNQCAAGAISPNAVRSERG